MPFYFQPEFCYCSSLNGTCFILFFLTLFLTLLAFMVLLSRCFNCLHLLLIYKADLWETEERMLDYWHLFFNWRNYLFFSVKCLVTSFPREDENAEQVDMYSIACAHEI